MFAFLDIERLLQLKEDLVNQECNIQNISQELNQQSLEINIKKKQLFSAQEELEILQLKMLKYIEQNLEILDAESISLSQIEQQNQQKKLIQLRINQLNEQINTEQEKLQQLNLQELELDNKLSKFNLQKKQLNISIEQLNQLISDQNNSIYIIQQQYDIHIQVIEARLHNMKIKQDEMTKTQQEITIINQQIYKLQQEAQELQKQLEKLTNKYEQYEVVFKQLQIEIENIQKARIISEDEYKKIQLQIEQNNQQMIQLNEDKKLLQEQLSQKQLKQEQFQEQLTQLIQSQGVVKEEILYEFVRLEKKNQELEKLHIQLEDAKITLCDIIQKALKQKDQSSLLEKSIKQTQCEIQSDKEKLDILQQTQKGLLNDFKNTKKNRKQVEQSIQQLQNDKSEKEQWIKQLNQQLGWLDQESKQNENQFKQYEQEEEEYLIQLQTQKEVNDQLEQESRGIEQELLQIEREEQQLLQNNNSMTQILSPALKAALKDAGSLGGPFAAAASLLVASIGSNSGKKNQLNFRKIEIQNKMKYEEQTKQKIQMNYSKNKKIQYQYILVKQHLNEQIYRISNQLCKEQIILDDLNQGKIHKEYLLVDLKKRESSIEDKVITSKQQVEQQDKQIKDKFNKIIEFEQHLVTISTDLQNLEKQEAQQNKIQETIIIQIQDGDLFIQERNQQRAFLDKKLIQVNQNINELQLGQPSYVIQLNQIKSQKQNKENEIFLLKLQATQLSNTKQEEEKCIKKLKSNLQEKQQEGEDIQKQIIQLRKDLQDKQYVLQQQEGKLNVFQNHLQSIQDEFWQEHIRLTQLYGQKQLMEWNSMQAKLKIGKMEESVYQKQTEFKMQNLHQEQSINGIQDKIEEELEKMYQKLLQYITNIQENQARQDNLEKIVATLEEQINKFNLNVNIKQEQINNQSLNNQQNRANLSIIKNALQQSEFNQIQQNQNDILYKYN